MLLEYYQHKNKRIQKLTQVTASHMDGNGRDDINVAQWAQPGWVSPLYDYAYNIT